MKTRIELTEDELTELILQHMQSKLGDEARIDRKKICIEVKSKQNYRSEWEVAAFRAVYEGSL